jgi:Tol biopolymer transport system component
MRSWHWLAPAALVSLAPMGAGCDITPDPEEEFKVSGVLSQATIDTTTTDHLRPAVAPDGTRILFITDAFASGKNAQTPAGDFVMVDMPGPGVIPDLVASVPENPGFMRINLGQIPSDNGNLFNPFESVKGEVIWTPDSQGFIAVIHNDDGNERLYRFDLGGEISPGQIAALNPELIDDVGFASVGNRNSYHYLSPAISPSGEWLAYARYYFRAGDVVAGIPDEAEYMAIHAYNLDTGQVVRVTNGSTLEQDPTWSPDGQQIIFTAQNGEVGTRDLMRVNFDSSQDADVREWIPWGDEIQDAPFTDGRVRLTTTAGTVDWKLPVGSFDATWMRDGRVVFVSTRRAPGVSERVRNLWVMNPDGSDQRLIYFTRWDESFPGTANYQSATSDAAGLIVFSTRNNRSDDFRDQKQDIWVLRGF